METIKKNIINIRPLSVIVIIGVFLFGFYLNSISQVTSLIWIFSIMAGITFQRSRLCFASSFRDLFLFGSTKTLKAILLGLMVSSFGFILVMRSVVLDPTLGSVPSDPYILPFGISTVIGGLLFGFGMVISGGCVSGSLYRIGEGYVASLATIFGVIIGLSALSLSWNWWWDLLIKNEPKIWLPQVLDMGYLGAFAVTLFLGLVIFIGLTIFEYKTGYKEFKFINKEADFHSLKEKIMAPLYAIFKVPWSLTIGAIIIGFISMFMLLIAKPFGVTGELFASSNRILDILGNTPLNKGLSDLGGCVANAASNSSFLTNSFAATWGIIPGSFIASSLSGEFKLRIPKEKFRFVQSIAGGIFMGYGAGLGIGCTLGSFYSAIPSMSLSGWLFGLALAMGAFFGTKIIKRF